MFVSKKKHNKACKVIQQLRNENFCLQVQIHRLRETSLSTQDIFDDEDIKSLISLCHPDKHANSKRATEITQKLLELKKDLS